MDPQRAQPDHTDVVKRVLEKVKLGRMTVVAADTGAISFQKQDCVLIPCTKETRSAVRIDVSNLTCKSWPQAMTFRMWRDASLDFQSWQVGWSAR